MADTVNFAPDFDAPLEYMRRTRDYYLALGYDNPYRWAHYTDAPFTPLKKPLKDSTLVLITTAAPYQPDKGDQGPGAAYNAGAKFYSGSLLPRAGSSLLNAFTVRRPIAASGSRSRPMRRRSLRAAGRIRSTPRCLFLLDPSVTRP